MGTLYLVRHGQASFGAADYDQLSALGVRQCHALGQWFAARGTVFEAVLCGTLRRHVQSLSALVDGYAVVASATGATSPTSPASATGVTSTAAVATTTATATATAAATGTGTATGTATATGTPPPALPWPGLNEYDSHALVHAIHPAPLPAADTPEAYRQHFRLLREGLRAWMAGSTAPLGMPTHAAFVAGVTSALDHVRSHCSGNALLVSSGGPIATAVGHVLGTAAETVIELNLRIRNSALTEFAFTPKRHMLVSYNALPHLEQSGRADWLTYS